MRILPRDEKFYDMFTELAKRLTDSATILKEMFNEPSHLDAKVPAIKAMGHAAEHRTHRTSDRSNRHVRPPSYRTRVTRANVSAYGWTVARES